MGYQYNGYEIQYYDHNNYARDYFVIDAEGDCIHYTGSEDCAMNAIDTGNFNLINRKKDL